MVKNVKMGGWTFLVEPLYLLVQNSGCSHRGVWNVASRMNTWEAGLASSARHQGT